MNAATSAAASSYRPGNPATNPLVQAKAAVHSYQAVSWWSAAFFADGLLISLALYAPRPAATGGDDGHRHWVTTFAQPQFTSHIDRAVRLGRSPHELLSSSRPCSGSCSTSS
jgi:hypothetical protein